MIGCLNWAHWLLNFAIKISLIILFSSYSSPTYCSMSTCHARVTGPATMNQPKLLRSRIMANLILFEKPGRVRN